MTRKTCLTIDTDAGPRSLELRVERGRVEEVTVDMGAAQFRSAVILEVEKRKFSVAQVWVGNPHGVIFCSKPEEEDLEHLGPALEHHPALEEQSNIEFAAPEPGGLNVRVWERGSGITLACGTGACAVFAAARQAGMCGDEAWVRLPGGTLRLEQKGSHMFLTGPARAVFDGEVEVSNGI